MNGPSKILVVTILELKSDNREATEKISTQTERATRTTVQRVGSDNATKFLCDGF